MKTDPKQRNCCRKDIACDNRMLNLIIWRTPYLLFLTGFVVFWFYPGWSGWLWFTGFSWLGIACLTNALYCKRKHCFFTGPLYLLLAILSVLIILNILAINWGYIWLAFVLGTIVSYIPEWRGSKYFRF